MKIYTFVKDALTDDNLVSILEKDELFTAMTRSESKVFKSFNAAKSWLNKRGYFNIISWEEF